MPQEQLFASFMLDREQGLEIALRAEQVTEATPIQGTLQKLPGSIDFLEGIMHLRNDIIPVINLKKRLGLKEKSYSPDAKVAVVSMLNANYGLLFEDIREVFRAEPSKIDPIHPTLRTEDQVISDLIKLEPGKRVIELLDLNNLFKEMPVQLAEQLAELDPPEEVQAATRYSRYVIFSTGGQDYGVTVDLTREITFSLKINDMFSTGMTAGAIELRGKTIPVLNTLGMLTNDHNADCILKETTRILILEHEDCTAGLIVDEIKEIITIPENEILPFPSEEYHNVKGLYPRSTRQNIILLDVYNLVCKHMEELKSVANIGNGKDKDEKEDLRDTPQSASHHLITENCYLIFTIGKNFAIEIKDVKEIIENTSMMNVPGAVGSTTSVINLRGEVVPVINLRNFYHFEPSGTDELSKLIICGFGGFTVALEVDQIVTIYKQEQFHPTPSLSKQLNDKRDTVDRLIEYLNDEGLKEHVLVLNVKNMISNHLQLGDQETPAPDSGNKEPEQG